MDRNQSKRPSNKPLEKKGTAFLEGLITKYFNRQSESHGEYHIQDPGFNKTEVYNKILKCIDEKERKSRQLGQVIRIAASVLIVFSLASAFYLRKDDIGNWLNPVKLVITNAAKGQTVLVKLEDGSRVWLNSDSKLSYPDRFNGKERKIRLTGEAYFEVVHIAEKPFIIESGDVKTVVLGTTFNIKAYPGNPKVEVTVLSGKVAVITPAVKDQTLNTVYVTPNQKAIYLRSDVPVQTTAVKAKESISWKDGKMLFHNTPLGQAIEEVERKYNIELSCSDNIRNCTITTTADLNNEGLDKVLKVMATTVNGSVSYQNGSYNLVGKGCE